MRDVERPDPQFVEQLWARLELEAFGPVRVDGAAAVERRLSRRLVVVAAAAAAVMLLVLTAGTLQTDPRAQRDLDVARMLPTPAPTTTVGPQVPELLPQEATPAEPAAQVVAAAPVPLPRPAPAPAPESAVLSAPSPKAAVDGSPPVAPVEELLFGYNDPATPDAELGLMALDGRKRVVVLTKNEDVADFMPDWAPDGKRIVFGSSNRNGHYPIDVYVREADGTERRLTEYPCEATQASCHGGYVPRWSPVDDTIAFTHGGPSVGCRPEVDECGTIMLVPASGGTPVRLTPGWRASWSPDGRQLAFVSTADEVNEVSCDDYYVERCVSDLFIINRDGTGLRPLGVRGDDPRWSPDGTRIAYDTSTTGAPGPVRTVRVDGTGDAPLTGPGHVQPAWSPDGRTVVTIKNTGGSWDLWLTDVASGTTTQLTRTPAIESLPVFRPRPVERGR